MGLNNLKITFYLDGTGVYYDPGNPIHLDALLAWALIPFHVELDNIGRSDVPYDVPLPLEKWKINNQWGWKASVLFPGENCFESIQYWRKKFRQDKIQLMKGAANLQQGIYREYNTPMCLVITDKMIAYCRGDRYRVLSILKKHIKYLGKKRAYGKGKIVDIKAEKIDEDYSIVKDGKASRWLPIKKEGRLVRCRPPYWNRIDRVNCCEIGDKYNDKRFY